MQYRLTRATSQETTCFSGCRSNRQLFVSLLSLQDRSLANSTAAEPWRHFGHVDISERPQPIPLKDFLSNWFANASWCRQRISKNMSQLPSPDATARSFSRRCLSSERHRSPPSSWITIPWETLPMPILLTMNTLLLGDRYSMVSSTSTRNGWSTAILNTRTFWSRGLRSSRSSSPTSAWPRSQPARLCCSLSVVRSLQVPLRQLGSLRNRPWPSSHPHGGDSCHYPPRICRLSHGEPGHPQDCPSSMCHSEAVP